MYHISNDERAKKSAAKIGNGLLNTLKTKNFTDITVTDVQKISGVGRATFYRLFDNMTDVLAYLCDNIFEKVGYEYEKMNPFTPKEASLKLIREWMNHQDLLKAIVDCNRMDLIYRSHAKYIGNDVSRFFPNESISKEQLNYLFMTMTACTAACLNAWLKNGAHETAEQLQKRLNECFKMLCGIYAGKQI